MSPGSLRSPAAPDDAPRILIVEDEESLARVMAGYFTRNGYVVESVGDGREAVEVARRFDPAVVILDLGLPGLDGVEVARRIRTFSDCYILMLTARADEVDELIGLSVGADDYVTKPFSPRLLIARVAAMQRRPRHEAMGDDATSIIVGGLTIDPLAREVLRDGRPVELTRTEFDLLTHLARNSRRAISRDELVEAVWGTPWSGDDQLVDTHIGHLRKKLGDSAAHPRFIETVRGIGYRMGSG